MKGTPAEGNVEIVQPDGTRIYADKVDITDDFKDGFVNALRVETTDNTRFAAQSAERTAGKVTTFNQGVYTACEPCKDNPDKPRRTKWLHKFDSLTYPMLKMGLGGTRKYLRLQRKTPSLTACGV